MIIKELSIKGFKSYGNNAQIIKFNESKGELILLCGINGQGKSAARESMEYVLFGKVRGRIKKNLTLSSLPNRINKEMLVKIKFIANGTEVEIHRGINPSVLTLIENGIVNDRAGKANLDEKIEKYIGMDFETFKSFISMSMNGFKNFMSLSNEEKQLLLDKLFNLEVINMLNTILKNLNKTNNQSMIRYDSEIRTLEESINSIKKSIEKALEKEKENIEQEIEEIKKEMLSKKEEFNSLKERKQKIEQKDEELKSQYDKERESISSVRNEISNVLEKISLYNKGKCPTCESDFHTDHFLNLKDLLVEREQSLQKLKLEIETNMKSIKEKQVKLKDMSDKINTTFNDLTFLLKNYKSRIDKLQLTKDNSKINENVNVQEFKNTLVDMETKKSTSSDTMSSIRDKELYYKELNKIFSEDGIKKNIISGIIKPINNFVAENVKKMKLNFDVVLDDTFTATIKQFGNVIEHESLSDGEHKRCNVCILFAYLKLIRTRKNINILFLDEVFASIDVNGVDCMLSLLRDFAMDYKINIFVVHHAILNQENFDRILQLEKNIFSVINEIALA